MAGFACCLSAVRSIDVPGASTVMARSFCMLLPAYSHESSTSYGFPLTSGGLWHGAWFVRVLQRLVRIKGFELETPQVA